MRKRTFMTVTTVVLMAVPSALAQDSIQLRNDGVGDGSLEVWPDAYGGFSNWAWTQNFDRYDPVGAVAANKLSFGANVMIYRPASLNRVALALPGQDTDAFYNQNGGGWGDGRGTYGELSALVGSDSSGNGTIDTANSSFWVLGTSTTAQVTFDLQIDLEQKLTGPDANGVATYTKTYSITNMGDNAADFEFEQHDDFDLLFDGNFSDPVGAASSAGRRNVYMHEPDNFNGFLSTAVALSGSDGSFYSAGRTQPAGPTPPYAYGSDGTQWRHGSAPFPPGAPGFPPAWQNHTAYIGYNTDGIDTSVLPAQGGAPNDGQMNLMWELNIPAGECVEVVIVHTYGRTTPLTQLPAPGPCGGGPGCVPCDMNCDTDINALDIEFFIDLLFNGTDPCCGNRGDIGSSGDVNLDGSIDANDIEGFINCLFP